MKYVVNRIFLSNFGGGTTKVKKKLFWIEKIIMKEVLKHVFITWKIIFFFSPFPSFSNVLTRGDK